jgi:hypothetical protein
MASSAPLEVAAPAPETVPAEVPVAVAAAPKVVRLARAGAVLGYDAASSVYPMFLAAGVLALAGLQIVRLVGVKK